MNIGPNRTVFTGRAGRLVASKRRATNDGFRLFYDAVQRESRRGNTERRPALGIVQCRSHIGRHRFDPRDVGRHIFGIIHFMNINQKSWELALRTIHLVKHQATIEEILSPTHTLVLIGPNIK